MQKANHADLLELEQTLLRQRTELIARLRARLQVADAMEVPDWFHSLAGGARVADVGLLDDITYAVHERELAELAEIDNALKRIDFHVAGSCAVCGAAIPVARLKAMPSATTCIACQKADEAVSS
jgi:phage/conjugal plasmid C-4 type zinc finger TraR family protein